MRFLLYGLGKIVTGSCSVHGTPMANAKRVSRRARWFALVETATSENGQTSPPSHSLAKVSWARLTWINVYGADRHPPILAKADASRGG